MYIELVCMGASPASGVKQEIKNIGAKAVELVAHCESTSCVDIELGGEQGPVLP